MVRPDWELEEAPYGCSEPWQNAALLTQSVIHRVRVAQIHSPVGGMLCRPLSACTDVAPQRPMGRRACGRLIWLKVNGVTRAVADGCLTPGAKGIISQHARLWGTHIHSCTQYKRDSAEHQSRSRRKPMFILYNGHLLDAYSSNLFTFSLLKWNLTHLHFFLFDFHGQSVSIRNIVVS